MAAPVEIVNRALSKIGQTRIVSLDQENKAAGTANSMFAVVRDAELSAHNWNFAKDRIMIPAAATTPAFGWRYQYLIPSDCLRVLLAGPWPQAVMSGYIGWDTSQYTIEGTHILTNLGPALSLQYLKRITDTGIYPSVFIEAFACKLAIELSQDITGDDGKKDILWAEYDKAIQTAKTVNAISLPPQMVQDDSWMLAHIRGVM